jgi:hypothetical protein
MGMRLGRSVISLAEARDVREERDPNYDEGLGKSSLNLGNGSHGLVDEGDPPKRWTRARIESTYFAYSRSFMRGM